MKKLVAFATATLVAITISVSGCGWLIEAEQVARNEVEPRALLKKYEWFKDASAQLDKKAVDIRLYKLKIANLKESYNDVPRINWDSLDKEQYNLYQQELLGVTSSYNDLAAEYNAQMAKVNWRFTNVGQLPAGATQTLPREYRTYQ